METTTVEIPVPESESSAAAVEAAEAAVALAHTQAAQAEMQAAAQVAEVVEQVEQVEDKQSWQNERLNSLEAEAKSLREQIGILAAETAAGLQALQANLESLLSMPEASQEPAVPVEVVTEPASAVVESQEAQTRRKLRIL